MKEVLDFSSASYEDLTAKISGIASMKARFIIPIREATALLLLGSELTIDSIPESEEYARVLSARLLMNNFETVKKEAPRAATLIGLLSPDQKYMSRIDGEIEVSVMLGDIFTVDGTPGFAELFVEYTGSDELIPTGKPADFDVDANAFLND